MIRAIIGGAGQARLAAELRPHSYGNDFVKANNYLKFPITAVLDPRQH